MTEWQNGKFCIQIKVIVWFSKKKLDLIYIYIINTDINRFIGGIYWARHEKIFLIMHKAN